MFFNLDKGQFKFASISTAGTQNLSEQTAVLVILQLIKGNHLLAAFVLTLMLHPLDQPGGEQGCAVPQVDRAGRALGNSTQGLGP